MITIKCRIEVVYNFLVYPILFPILNTLPKAKSLAD